MWVDPLVRGSARTRNLETNFFFFFWFQAIGKLSQEKKIKIKHFARPPAPDSRRVHIFFSSQELSKKLARDGSRDELAPGMDPVCVCVCVCVFPVYMPCARVGSYIQKKNVWVPPAADFGRAAFFFWERYAKDSLNTKKQ